MCLNFDGVLISRMFKRDRNLNVINWNRSLNLFLLSYTVFSDLLIGGTSPGLMMVVPDCTLVIGCTYLSRRERMLLDES